MYNDIVVLPIRENMNDGKTYSFFQWAATGAWVPPIYYDHFESVPQNLSYTNRTAPAPVLAQHDPVAPRPENVFVSHAVVIRQSLDGLQMLTWTQYSHEKMHP